MTLHETLVTPEMAMKWLEGEAHNRALRSSVVERYARDMKAGKWQLTHEAIAFDFNKVLIDGQHRLWAVIESKVPIRFMVARDVRPETRAVINSGLARTDVDHLQFGYDMRVTPMHAAIAKRLFGSALMNKTRPTTDELRLILINHSKAIDFSVSAFTRIIRGITIAPVMTVIMRAFYHADHDKLRHFVEVLCSGRMMDMNEEPIIMLRNFLLERGATTTIQYAKTERSLKAYLNEEKLSTLYAAPNELFPLPEEATKKVRKHEIGSTKTKTVVVGKKLTPRLRKSTKGQEITR
jgi:hypothetical protein